MGVFQRFTTDIVIKKSIHGYDTNAVEVMGRIVTDVAPKMTFHGQRGGYVAAVGIAAVKKNEGRTAASRTVLTKMNLPQSRVLRKQGKVWDRETDKRKALQQTPYYKRQR
jgi:hypothetical protein